MQTRTVEIRKRITFLFFCIFFVIILLCFRLIWLQLVRGTWYQQEALQNRIREIVVEPKRGVIYDRNGNELAISINVDAVYAVPAEVMKSGKTAQVAREVARILHMKEKEVYELITENQHSVWIKFKVDPAQARELRARHLPGIGVISKPQRFYPKNNLASHVLGIAGAYNQGLEGIEVQYDKELSGIKGRLLVEYDAAGREIPGSTHRYIEPEQGLSLVLTIDQTIQYIAERELDKVMQERHPKSASIIVMDPQTGEILAMANRPDFDPNDYQKYPVSARRNIAIANSYEPGSTFKIVTLSAALQEGLVDSNSRFYDPGYIKVGGEFVHCWLPEGHGSQSLAEVVQNSCNPGFVNIGLRLGTEKFYKYLKAFGFGALLGIDLPGEAGGIIVPQDDAKPIDLASMSIGQANSVTPLQLVSAMAAVANGGKLMKPHLVKEMKNSKGQVVKRFKPQVLRQVISPETAREVRNYLEQVVSNGTGRNAYIPGYSVGGKTGTAQKPAPHGGYSTTDHIASFLGFAPVDSPRLAVLVVVDSPQGYPYYGGTVAAPVFREVVRDSLRYLGVPLRYQPKDAKLQEDMTVVPPVINLPVQEAEKVLKEAGLEAEKLGNGKVVYGQVPLDGVKVKKGSKVLLNLTMPKQETSGERVVPDLKGKSLRDAAELLGLMNLVLIPEGEPIATGTAVEQSPPPGTRVSAGSRVRVKFSPPPITAIGP
ncbi:MAG TPA: stage V sporulation protein D [Syntrophomonadaceae bacterium]|nr:stage V sporulation protein D [Syntrophomonadaceae bacterium]